MHLQLIGLLALGLLVFAPPSAEARTKAGITPLAACATKQDWKTLNETLNTRRIGYDTTFIDLIKKGVDKRKAARDAKRETGKGQPVDVNCRALPGGRVTMEDKGGWSGYVCVRARGWKNCGWTYKGYFTRFFRATSDPTVWERGAEQELLYMYR
eukprot:jgi/Tetstr1/443194/TSEL_031234.t1